MKGQLIKNREYITSKYGDKLYLDEDVTYVELAILQGKLPKTEEIVVYEAFGTKKEINKAIEAYKKEYGVDGEIIYI